MFNSRWWNKKYKAQQAFEHKLNNATKSHIFVHTKDMSFYGLLERVTQLRLNDESNGDYRIIMTTRGLCNTLFYDELQIRGNIHNGKIKLSKGNQIIGFEMDGITIDENEHYQEVHMTICALNETISKETEKYKYTGQTLHLLAYAYYSNNYDRQIISKCSPQIYDILTSKASMNSPLLEFYKEEDKGSMIKTIYSYTYELR